jgi:hypothetical protein
MELKVLQNRLSELQSRRPEMSTSIYVGGLWVLEVSALSLAIAEFVIKHSHDK